MAINPPSASSVIATSAVMSAICVLVTILRFWARRLQKNQFMLDDWSILPALLLSIGIGAILIIGTCLKLFAYPAPSVDPEVSKDHLTAQFEWAFYTMQVLHLGFIKLSFVFFCRRIFLIDRYSAFGIASLVMMTVIISWTLAFFLTFLFDCKGMFSAWISVEALQSSCVAVVPIQGGFVISDFIMDLMVVIMPIPMASFFPVWRLKMANIRKIGVTAVFALGAVAVVASLIRLLTFFEASAGMISAVYAEIEAKRLEVAFKSASDNDLLAKILFWSMIESDLASIAVCLPVVHSLFRRISLEPMIRTVRSITSKGSSLVGWRGWRPSNTAIPEIKNHNDSTTSHAQISPTYLEPATFEAYALRDYSETFNDHNALQGEIMVSNAVTKSQCAA